MKIQVLGSGCATCKKLYEMTERAAKELGMKDEVEYLTGSEGVGKIVEMGVMSSPVLAVEGKPVMVGFIPNIEKIKGLISGGCGEDCECKKRKSARECGGKC